MARIKVRVRKSGKTGTIPEEEFDESIYERMSTSVYGAEQPGSPLMKTLAKLQTFLGESEALPIAYGTLGSFAGPWGTAGGTAGGIRMKQMLQARAGGETIPEALVPSAEEAGETVKGAAAAGLTHAALNQILRLLPKVLRPRKYVGGKIESLTERAGAVPEEALVEKFGTTGVPEQSLYKGLAPAGGEATLKRTLAQEIAAQGRTPGGVISEPTLSDILQYRKGAYAAGYEKTAPKALQSLYKNIGRAYSEILKENVPGLKPYDTAYNWLSKAEKGVGAAKRYAPRAALYYIMYRMISKIANAFSGD